VVPSRFRVQVRWATQRLPPSEPLPSARVIQRRVRRCNLAVGRGQGVGDVDADRRAHVNYLLRELRIRWHATKEVTVVPGYRAGINAYPPRYPNTIMFDPGRWFSCGLAPP
jgi:hypothetical protein